MLRHKTLKLLEKNTGESLCIIGIDEERFLKQRQ